jgi:Tfp pilus assembly protein PilX
MQHFVQGLRSKGFALPTVLIASVVLLTVLAVSVTATAAVRTSLKTQYYTQLAQAAGEAGVAYAKACLAESENTPEWDDTTPLKPNTDCSGTAIPGADDTVMTNGNIRSKFSVGSPTLDSDGKAVTIPNSGFVEVIRTSNGSVWRTYTQPSAQAAVVPDLCSGQSASSLGWNNAYVVSASLDGTDPDSAQPIAIDSANDVYTGPHYFSKSFTVTSAGQYNISSSAGATYDLFVDGELVAAQKLNIKEVTSVDLDIGCHSIMARVVNGAFTASGSELRLTVRKDGASVPIVTTDSSWRVTAGNLVPFSHPNYHQIPLWSPVRDIGAYTVSPWTGGPTDWATEAGDVGARWISTDHSFSGTNYPFASYAYFINNNRSTWKLSAPTEFKFVISCDNNCRLLIDGEEIIYNTATWTSISTAAVTLSEGQHQIAVELYNTGASNNASGLIFSAIRTSDNVVVDRSGSHWSAASSWYSTPQSFVSYDTTYTPVPATSDTANVTALLVGGGGGGGRSVDATRGGGGGGGGGMIEQTVSLSAGVYPVTVGAGGIGTSGTGTTVAEVNNLGNGGNTTFAFLMALGGGGGGQGGGGIGVYGGSGGGSGRNNATIAPGVTGQGNSGGAGAVTGTTASYGAGGGGGAGGAGGTGTTTVGGAGGVGRTSSITGSFVFYAGGGGGARPAGSGGAGGSGGGGAGASSSAAGTNGTNGLGGGGGGAGTNGVATRNGGTGGSGVVIIRYPTGTLTATGGTVTTLSGETLHTFTSSGTFTVLSVN